MLPDYQTLYFTGAFANLQEFGIPQKPFYMILFGVAIPAVNLNSFQGQGGLVACSDAKSLAMEASMV